MKVFKRVCAVVIAATMVVSGLDGYGAKSVYAADGLEACGDNLFTAYGGGSNVLTIGVKDKNNYSGREMRSYAYNDGGTDEFPWSGVREEVKNIEIEEGVESISANAFSDMPLLEHVTIPKTVEYIGKDAFSASNNIKQVIFEGTALEWEELIKNGIGLNLTLGSVRTTGGQGAKIDLESNTITLNTQKPLPEKTYEEVSCFTKMVDYEPFNAEYLYCSNGVFPIDATKGIEIYERWQNMFGPDVEDFYPEFENNQLYCYRAYIDFKGPGFENEDLTKYNVEVPNVKWKYKRLQYLPDDHVIYFVGYYLNGNDPHPSINIGRKEYNLSNGKTVTYEREEETEAELVLRSLDIFEDLGELDYSFENLENYTDVYKLDLDKDSKYDVVITAQYTEGCVLENMTIEKCKESAINDVFELVMSEDTAAYASCLQHDRLYYSKFIFDLTDDVKKDEPKEDDTKKDEPKKDTPKSKVPAVGETVKDSKFAYKVVKAGSEDGKTAGEVEITGCEKKKVASVNIPAEVKIGGVTYKVTSIADYAFKNNKKLKKVTIGKNIAKIGKGAFFGCKNLKTIKIKTTLLTKKSVGANAFKKINKKATVKVPKKVRKAYKKLLKAKGVKGKKQKIK